MKILMVCIGNICRSPMAEGILKKKAQGRGLNWKVDSAATEAYHLGSPPHPLSMKVCALNEIDISGQRARQVGPGDLDAYDKVYVMARDVYETMRQRMGGHPQWNKVQYFLQELEPDAPRDVPDPWYGEEDGYHEVFELIHRGCEAILSRYAPREAESTTRGETASKPSR